MEEKDMQGKGKEGRWKQEEERTDWGWGKCLSHWEENLKMTNRFPLHKGGRRWERTEKSETGLFLKSGSVSNQHSRLTFKGEKC